MRLRIIDIEGSAEEFGQLPQDVRSALIEVGQRSPGTGAVGTDEGDALDEETTGASGATMLTPDRQLPKDVHDFIAVRAGGVSRAKLVEAWIVDVLGWGTTVVDIGRSRTAADGFGNYLLMYAKGPRRFGAFAYVVPGNAKVTLRLLGKDAEGFTNAELRSVKAGTGYEVMIPLQPEEAYNEALSLAKVALDRVL